jgi:hypothetical protein
MCISTPNSGRCLAILVSSLIALLLSNASLLADAPSTQPGDPAPSAQLQPEDVIRIVVEALGKNDQNDSGIRTAWKFASPDNQRATGPIERFIPMVKSPAYAPLLNFKSVTYGPFQEQHGQAMRAIRITQTDGKIYYFVFALSRQTNGPMKDCWLTDGVMPLRPQGAPQQQPPTQEPPQQPGSGTPT